jgi:hypothetical protein
MYQTLLIIYLQTVSAMLYTFNKTIIIVVFTPQPTSPEMSFSNAPTLLAHVCLFIVIAGDLFTVKYYDIDVVYYIY